MKARPRHLHPLDPRERGCARSAARGSVSRDSLDCNRSFSGRTKGGAYHCGRNGQAGGVRAAADGRNGRAGSVRSAGAARSAPIRSENCRYPTAEGFGLFYLACPGAGQSPGLACSDTSPADTRHSGAVLYIPASLHLRLNRHAAHAALARRIRPLNVLFQHAVYIRPPNVYRGRLRNVSARRRPPVSFSRALP